MSDNEDQQRNVVVITGSSGYIGSALVKKLAEQFRVVAFDRETSPHPPVIAECICIDLTADDSIAAALARLRTAYGGRIASVIHLAAYFDLSGEPDPKYQTVTVNGTARFLRGLQEFELEQFIFVSTMLVHAPGEHGKPINEDWPLDPKLPYRESKILTERLIREQRANVPVVLVRPAGVYDDLCHAPILAHQIARIHERRLISHLYAGRLDTGQSWLHLDDLTQALLQVVVRRHELPAELPLLLGESEVLSFDEIQRELGQLIHGEAWQTTQLPKPLAKTGAWVENEILQEDPFVKPWMIDVSEDHYELDTSRARALLGWKPQFSLRETLPKMVGALKRDPVSFYRANKLNAAKVAAQNVTAKPAHEGSDGSAHAQEMMREHMQDMRKMHFDMLWVHYLNLLLGAWLASSPFWFGSFGQEAFGETVLQVTQERGLQPLELRSTLLGWSSLVSGLLIMLFSLMSLSPRLAWAQWANTTVGVWLLLAPLVFWAPSAAVYVNNTMIGALVITFSILVPMMPGMSMESMMDKSDVPPGWTYSPSTYLQRLPIIALGAFGFLISAHLAAYQMGHVNSAWDPFFAGAEELNGTETIITSDVSKAWPVADAGLGGVAYLFEVLMGVMGGRQRWRTMPWMVAMFGFVVVPLGVVSIYFIIIQPIVIGTWCSLCLLAGIAMLVMIPYSLDELVAMGQYLAQSMRRGEPFWCTFFRGGAQPDGSQDDHPDFDAPLALAARSAALGVTVPWNLVASAVLGLWLMFTRLIFGTEPPMANSDHLVGALIITVAVIAMAEVARPLRFLNVGFGVWLIAAPWMLEGASVTASWAGVFVGLAVVALSLPRGRLSREHYGSWDRFIV
ncbi:vitamin K epoxide reductase family protein [Nitrosovibrio sp. Nv6]|uniref:SPW repeat domain-containing protein n=1 Tax=Nitrosovibrio sp. Nv6 TaxID=1855340 RepID=UPI0008B17C4D|nr:vitamin K epoxide reductase family protein [Nitrosovibrio sp. Nv6]SEP43564.1 Nucleoside-diphosphate-sugar epimerase [Nitrosovibrio sp. Nv6]